MLEIENGNPYSGELDSGDSYFPFFSDINIS